jgi:hypothetical protein
MNQNNRKEWVIAIGVLVGTMIGIVEIGLGVYYMIVDIGKELLSYLPSSNG